jgi:hypothetical protein
VQFKDGKLGIVFDDGGPFPAGYDATRGECKGITSNQTFLLVELSKSDEAATLQSLKMDDEVLVQRPTGRKASPHGVARKMDDGLSHKSQLTFHYYIRCVYVMYGWQSMIGENDSRVPSSRRATPRKRTLK